MLVAAAVCCTVLCCPPSPTPASPPLPALVLHPLQGQVYRGRLKTGEEVAVKVQRPGVLVSHGLVIIIILVMHHSFSLLVTPTEYSGDTDTTKGAVPWSAGESGITD